MASYFWVGGTGTWSGTGNTQFAVTSGGVATLLDPTNVDIVTFDANSGTATTVTCTATAVSLSTTINKADITLSLSGNTTLCTAAGICTLTEGTLNLNGFVLSTGSFNSSNTNIRALNLGASTVMITGTGTVWNITDSTNMTLTAGTSTITTTGTTASITFAGGGLTYYNVTFGATYYNTSLSGANTFNNLTVASPAGVGRRSLSFSANQTINGTLNCTGSAANSRPRLVGAVGGTTLTTAYVALSDVDFSAIITAGASSPWSGTRLGNSGGNTNIIFATPKTLYWNRLVGGNWSDVAWATSSGGTVNINNFPLGQDTAILDNTGVDALSTIAMDYGWVLPSISAGSLTNALTINWNTFSSLTASIAGPTVTLSSAITFTLIQGSVAFNPISNGTITTAGVSFPMQVTLTGSSGITVTLADNFTCTGKVNIIAGTVDLNGKTLTGDNFDGTFADLAVRTIAFNGGQINVTGFNTTVWAWEDLTNFSYTGTPTVNFTYSGSTGTRTISNGGTAGATETNTVDINILNGADAINTYGALTSCRNFFVATTFTGNTGLFGGGFIYGNLTLSPNQTVTSSTSAVTFAATSGVKTITTNGIAFFRNMIFDGVGGTWQLQDALNFGISGRTLTLINGTFDANNYSVTGARVLSSNSNVRTLKLGSANWTITADTVDGSNIEWNFTNSTNLTITGTGLIVLTGNQIVVFQGGSRNWPGLVLDPLVAGTAERWIYGSNTFGSITGTTLNYSVSFEASTTQTVNTFNVSGTAGNLVTLNSLTPGTRWNIAKNTGGKVLVSYVSISDSATTPAGYWFAPTSQNNVNDGNNTGWNFGAEGGTGGGFLPFF
jgi:hypothetical protein